MQKTVPWAEYLRLDSAMAKKGPAGLDDEEKVILGQALQTTFYCSQKVAR
jgi:NADPH:quinone reductase-like Zn-dependent oxidoreductase